MAELDEHGRQAMAACKWKTITRLTETAWRSFQVRLGLAPRPYWGDGADRRGFYVGPTCGDDVDHNDVRLVVVIKNSDFPNSRWAAAWIYIDQRTMTPTFFLNPKFDWAASGLPTPR